MKKKEIEKKEVKYKFEKEEPMVVREPATMQYDYQMDIPPASICIEKESDESLDAAYEKYVIDAALESQKNRRNGGRFIEVEDTIKALDKIIASTSFLSDQLVGIVEADINEDDTRMERLKKQ